MAEPVFHHASLVDGYHTHYSPCPVGTRDYSLTWRLALLGPAG
ncbi:MAG TPA: hypothetical protein PLN56_08000 [Methanoregulaceae archaeon]|nr:hypothetical protein [Methanoregulaceae archaeon]HPD10925.1 hypothetical protein [Methanoregulaceae archaeon]HRT16069.1 hypothetical protein [Methanoregulaceae archaeon]HRU31575.1 hypothetical protein [Methanoregulaceae archaeon]